MAAEVLANVWTEVRGKICDDFVRGPWRVYFDGLWRLAKDGADLRHKGGARLWFYDARGAKKHAESIDARRGTP